MASNDERWKALCEAGDDALRRGQFAEAEAHYRQALREAEAVPGDLGRGTTAFRLGRYSEAEALLRRALMTGNLPSGRTTPKWCWV